MGIIVKHQGNPAAFAAASFEGGRGRRRAQDRSQATSIVASEMASERNFAQQEHMRQMSLAGRESMMRSPNGRNPNGLNPSSGSRAPKRIEDMQLNPRGGNRLNNPYEVATQPPAVSQEIADYLAKRKIDSNYDIDKQKLDRETFDYQLKQKAILDRAQGDYESKRGASADREKFDYEYSQKQRDEVNQLNEAYENARKSGDFNEAELSDIRRQIVAKQAGIEPLPKLPEKQQDPWEIAKARIFVDPETGRRGYLNKDDVPEFFETPETFDRKEFDKRYRDVSTALTKPKFETDKVSGKQVQVGEIAPSREEILSAIREQDAAAEEYRKGSIKAVSQEDGYDFSNPPESDFGPEEIEQAGQDPDKIGGYSEIKLTNGKHVPNMLAPFFSNGSVDQARIKAYAEKKSKESGGRLAPEDVVAVIEREFAELATTQEKNKGKK